MSHYIIAIDGYASCGKSTLAKEIARKLHFTYIDSGAMYRAVTLFLARKKILSNGKFNPGAVLNVLDDITINFSFNPDSGVSETLLNGQNVEREIRLPLVSGQVSPVSTIPEVRSKMVDLQRRMSSQQSVVMDGRDIGTVVFPHADIKLFMTASPDVRAKRRYDELLSKGETVTIESVKSSLLERDKIDENRPVAPLKKASDAVVIDNSFLKPAQQFELAIELIYNKIPCLLTAR